MALVDFSPEDIRHLRKIIRSEMQNVINTPGMPNPVENDHQAPEVYVAFTPADGIPALTTVGTGTAIDDSDTPGSAVCTIGRIDPNNDNVVIATGTTATIYNLQGADIAGSIYIGVHRSKYGEWLATSSSPCGSQNEIQQIIVIGTPTGGTLTIYLELNDVEEPLVINYDDRSDEVEIALQDHSELSNVGTATGSASDDLTVTAGPLPDTPIRVEFIGSFANTAIPLMYADFSSLTGGTGVGVFVVRERAGRSG